MSWRAHLPHEVSAQLEALEESLKLPNGLKKTNSHSHSVACQTIQPELRSPFNLLIEMTTRNVVETEETIRSLHESQQREQRSLLNELFFRFLPNRSVASVLQQKEEPVARNGRADHWKRKCFRLTKIVNDLQHILSSLRNEHEEIEEKLLSSESRVPSRSAGREVAALSRLLGASQAREESLRAELARARSTKTTLESERLEKIAFVMEPDES